MLGRGRIGRFGWSCGRRSCGSGGSRCGCGRGGGGRRWSVAGRGLGRRAQRDNANQRGDARTRRSQRPGAGRGRCGQFNHGCLPVLAAHAFHAAITAAPVETNQRRYTTRICPYPEQTAGEIVPLSTKNSALNDEVCAKRRKRDAKCSKRQIVNKRGLFYVGCRSYHRNPQRRAQ